MNHSFNIDLAKKYGIEESIIIENMAFWLKKNMANNKNFNDGKYWVYNSINAFHLLFPYMAIGKIKRCLSNLEDMGVLASNNYNKVAYDRTKWYSIIDISICQIYTLHLSNLTNGLAKYDQPIPIINTDIKTTIINKEKPITKYHYKEDLDLSLHSIFEEFLDIRRKLKAVNSERSIKLLVNTIKKHYRDIRIQEYMINKSIMNSWKGIFQPNQKDLESIQGYKSNQDSKLSFQHERLKHGASEFFSDEIEQSNQQHLIGKIT